MCVLEFIRCVMEFGDFGRLCAANERPRIMYYADGGEVHLANLKV